jgi:hypothetical protein
MSQDHIRVAVRIRPLNEAENKAGHTSICRVVGNSIQVDDGRGPSGITTFTFGELCVHWCTKRVAYIALDRVFEGNCQTSEVYDTLCRDIVRAALDGVHGE